ncbi:hypothetical protein GCM10009788_15310 [Nocardioides humi]|uniref:Uncharacterized protein n=1 Tax=Nocardioides humi TaxID=449461 RepID=A0ABN2A5I4_9ACTN
MGLDTPGCDDRDLATIRREAGRCPRTTDGEPAARVRLGSLLADVGREVNAGSTGSDLELERDRTASEPIRLE